MDTTTPDTPLEYAKGERRASPKLSVRYVLLMVVMGGLPLLMQPVMKLAAHFKSLGSQRGVMSHVAPPEQVVYEEDPEKAAALLASGQGYVRRGIAACLRPAAWERFGWHHIHACPVFLHARRTPGGEERVVTIDISEPARSNAATEPIILLQLNAVVPGSLLRPADAPLLGAQTFSVFLGPADRARVYAGQPDAADPTHFTFDVEVNGQRTTIDGHLADGGTVTLKPRAGLEDVPSTWEPPGSTWADRFK